MKIEIADINSITPYENNPRKLSDKAIETVAMSLKEYGFRQPIVVDKDRIIVVGHTRFRASKKLNFKEVPITIADNLTPEQINAYRIADNRTSEESEWDSELLKMELKELDLKDFDLELTGFNEDQLNSMLFEEKEGLTDEDAVPELPEEPITKLGDIWKLGNHRVMCGDSTIQDSLNKLMDNNLADLLHTDPPYNVNYSNIDRPNPSKKNLGKIKNDVMSKEEFYQFLKDSFTSAYTFLKKDSTAYIWHSDKESINFMKSFIDSGFNFSQQVIWKKPMLLGRGRYQYAHEPCMFGFKGSPYFTDDRKKLLFGILVVMINLKFTPNSKPIFIPEEA